MKLNGMNQSLHIFYDFSPEIVSSDTEGAAEKQKSKISPTIRKRNSKFGVLGFPLSRTGRIVEMTKLIFCKNTKKLQQDY